jgi:hypothetical protein
VGEKAPSRSRFRYRRRARPGSCRSRPRPSSGGLLVRVLGVSAYVSPSVTAWGLGRGLLVGVAIGVLGGVYPAWRVTRMTPLKALAGT